MCQTITVYILSPNLDNKDSIVLNLTAFVIETPTIKLEVCIFQDNRQFFKINLASVSGLIFCRFCGIQSVIKMYYKYMTRGLTLLSLYDKSLRLMPFYDLALDSIKYRIIPNLKSA